jgi:pyrophosphatase PpaX
LSPTTIKGYIFDLDHTLLESDRAQIDAALMVFRDYGLIKTESDVLPHFDKATDDMMKSIAGEAIPLDAHQLGLEHTRNLLKLIPAIPLYLNADGVLHKIHVIGGKITFASNNYNDVIAAILKHFKWDVISMGFIGIDAVVHRKPHPEMVQKAVDLLQLSPEECVMVGDSLFDIRAGKSAGTYTVAVCTGSFQECDFAPLRPNLIIKSIGDLFEYIPLGF